MAYLYFTPNLARQVECPPGEFEASTVRELLDGYFSQRPAVRGYVLDDQGAVRKHVKVVVDDTSLDYLAGSEIDFVTEMVGSAFQINNPNATSGCGCGASFSM